VPKRHRKVVALLRQMIGECSNNSHCYRHCCCARVQVTSSAHITCSCAQTAPLRLVACLD
jgi:hypothetical protein